MVFITIQSARTVYCFRVVSAHGLRCWGCSSVLEGTEKSHVRPVWPVSRPICELGTYWMC